MLNGWKERLIQLTYSIHANGRQVVNQAGYMYVWWRMKSDLRLNYFISLHLTGWSKIPQIIFVQFVVDTQHFWRNIYVMLCETWQHSIGILGHCNWQQTSQTMKADLFNFRGTLKPQCVTAHCISKEETWWYTLKCIPKSLQIMFILKTGEPCAKHTVQSCSWNWLPHWTVFFCLEMQRRRKCDRSPAE